MTPVTDPAEEYFKDGLWAWATDQWIKLVADAQGRLQVHTCPHAIWQATGVTQVLKRVSANNAITIIYTVPSGKTFYLCNMHMSGVNAGGALATGYVYIRTGAPAETVRWDINCQDADQRIIDIPFNPPVEMPEDYQILVRSMLANYHLFTTIHGYTI